jgi:peptidoglycan/xylan/chitin deacetylase (PgdA/CDA1 family)
VSRAGQPVPEYRKEAEAHTDAGQDCLVTISVDDGHPSDLRTADLLAKLGYSATFYVPASNVEGRPVLKPHELRQLSETFEIGSHTYNHRPLTDLSITAAHREVVDGKAWLDDALSRPTASFCYPRGKFSKRLTEVVAAAGFRGARTTMNNIIAGPSDVFRAGVTTQALSHGPLVQIRHAALERNWAGIANYVRVFRFETDWARHFDRAVSRVCTHGGVAHLWFHSWKVDETDQWESLEQVLGQLKSEYHFRSVTNGELFTRYASSATP